MKFYLNILIISILGNLNAQNWQVNPTDYELQMTITGILSINNEISQNNSNTIGAFVNDECRGFTNSLSVMDNEMFFLTIYSNTPSEIINFKVYTDQEYLSQETEIFIPFGSLGTPGNPYIWNVFIGYDFPPLIMNIPAQTIEQGYSFDSIDLSQYTQTQDDDIVYIYFNGNENLNYILNEELILNVEPISSDWVGTEEVQIIIEDISENQLSDTTTTSFTILAVNHAPTIYTIPDQTIGIGGQFELIYLNSYFSDEDGDEVEWNYNIITNYEAEENPNWQIIPSEFELSMSVTAMISLNGIEAQGNQHQLGAFVNGELRGVSNAILALDKWMYFLTIYSNENNEEIEFKFFDDELNVQFPTIESIVFLANESIGAPQNPFEITAGFLNIEIQENIASIEIIDFDWFGNEIVEFVVSESNTLQLYSESTFATFTVMPDHHPHVLDIPEQIVESGNNFNLIDLSQYLIEEDGDEIEWTVSGNFNLFVEIENQIANISYNDWVGTEILTFTATDQTVNEFSSSTDVELTVLNLDTQPSLMMPDSQIVGFSGDFDEINLNQILIENDGDEIEWSYSHQVLNEDENPNWQINPTEFELSMTITATVEALGNPTESGGNSLVAFSDGEIRGVANPIFALGKWIYFLTIYSNQNGDELNFKVFDENSSQILPMNYQTQFVANQSNGSPQNPLEFRAGQILVDITDDNLMDFTIVDPNWFGEEIINIIATDVGTLNNYSAQTQVTLTVLPDNAPVLAGIPDQAIETFHIFSPFLLTNYLTELDGDSIIWSVEHDSTLIVVETYGYVTISPSDFDWVGSSIVIFTATDNTINGLSSSQAVTFTVNEQDNPPAFIDSPILETTLGTPFPEIDLENFVEELDGDSIQFDYDFPVSETPILDPNWNLNVGEFELSMTMTSIVDVASKPKIGNQHLLAAFSGDEIRGIANAVTFADKWVYFLTIYSNNNNDDIQFKFFDNDNFEIFPTDSEIQFIANSSIGNPTNPHEINAGYVQVEIIENIANFTTIPQFWTGTTFIDFIVKDIGSINEYNDLISIPLTIENDFPVCNISNQFDIIEDQQIESVNLSQYISDFGTPFESLSFEVSNNLNINPAISNGILNFNISSDYFGTDTILLSITDDHLTDPKTTITEILFNILPVNDPPNFELSETNLELIEDFLEPISIDVVNLDHPENESNQEIVFSLVNNLEGLISSNIDSQTGTITINPIEHQYGAIQLTIVANDGQEENNEHQIIVPITVSPVDDLPNIISSPIEVASTNVEYNYHCIVEEYDGEPLTFELISSPETMQIYQNGYISWIPTEEYEDQIIDIEIAVSDLNNTVIQTYELSVSGKVYAQLTFEDGNNLVSFPGYLEDNNTVNFVEQLSEDDGEVNFIIGQGTGLFSVYNGWSGNLNYINPHEGYWLNFINQNEMDIEREFEFLHFIEDCQSYVVDNGNNLISFKWGYTDSVLTLDALGGLETALENFNFIIGEGVGLFNLGDHWSGNLDYLENFNGYWINVKDEIENINFKWGMENCDNPGNSSILVNNNFYKNIPNEFQVKQSSQQAFYLIENVIIENHIPSPNDLILAYADEVLVGSANYNEELTTLPVMGKDESLVTNGYCEIGEIPQFKFYNSTTNNFVELESNHLGFHNLLVEKLDYIIEESQITPESFNLYPAFPNPFNPETTIKFEIPFESVVNISIYDIQGKFIESLIDSKLNEGFYTLNWNGNKSTSGLYILKMITNDYSQSQKLILVK